MEWTERLLGIDPNVVGAAQAVAEDGRLVIAELLGSGTPQQPYLLRVRVDNAPKTNGTPPPTDGEPTAVPGTPRLPTFREIYAAGDHLTPGSVMMLPPLIFMADRPTEGPHPNLELENSVELLQTGLAVPAGQIVPLHNPPPRGGRIVSA